MSGQYKSDRYGYELSIVVITMNRREQLIEALESCLASRLPEKTEFVIINNGSTDDTDAAVRSFIQKHPERIIHYRCEAENLGVGGGRAAGFELAQGEYLYFLDDDAIIAEDSREDFFIRTIAYLERNTKVASVTTRIKDIMLEYDRGVKRSGQMIDGYPAIFKFLGGSHFLRKSAFTAPLYFPIEYGSEEYAPSILAHDKGLFHVYDDSIYIIHKPKVNKWAAGSESMEKIQVCGCAVTYATKKLLYPIIFHPLLYAAYRVRCHKFLRPYRGAVRRSDRMVREIVRENPCGRVRASTVIRMYREFGATVF